MPGVIVMLLLLHMLSSYYISKAYCLNSWYVQFYTASPICFPHSCPTIKLIAKTLHLGLKYYTKIFFYVICHSNNITCHILYVTSHCKSHLSIKQLKPKKYTCKPFQILIITIINTCNANILYVMIIYGLLNNIMPTLVASVIYGSYLASPLGSLCTVKTILTFLTVIMLYLLHNYVYVYLDTPKFALVAQTINHTSLNINEH